MASNVAMLMELVCIEKAAWKDHAHAHTETLHLAL